MVALPFLPKYLTYAEEIVYMLRSYGSPETLYNMALIKLFGTNVLRKFP